MTQATTKNQKMTKVQKMIQKRHIYHQEYCTQNEYSQPKFYTTPKIHKKGIPRPSVICSVDCHTSNFSRYIEYHLQPTFKQVLSKVKDNSDFINKVKDLGLPKDSILASLDVQSLYTNIPTAEGIVVLRRLHEKYKLRTLAAKLLATILRLIFTLNNFIFNSKFRLQIKGCTVDMCGPYYTNIFMAYFEQKFIYSLIAGKKTSP